MSENNSVCIVTPTTGSSVLKDCIESVQSLFVPEGITVKHLIVIDGQEYDEKVNEILKTVSWSKIIEPVYLSLHDNIGGNGFVSHRTYASAPYLVNEKWITFLDQDNFVSEDHIAAFKESVIDKGCDWGFTRRNIVDPSGNFVCKDECESLGPDVCTCLNSSDYLVDTNCYFFNREKVAVKISPVWYGKARQPNEMERDRAVCLFLKHNFKNYSGTNKFTLNYRVAGRSDSVQAEFFLRGNQIKKQMNDIITIGS